MIRAAYLCKAAALKVWDALAFCAALFVVGAFIGLGLFAGTILGKAALGFLRGGI